MQEQLACACSSVGGSRDSWHQEYASTASRAPFALAPGGDVFQFGVATGNTLSQLQRCMTEPGRHFFGFDTFSGMPVADSGEATLNVWKQGAFFGGRAEQLAARLGGNVTMIAGKYSDSLKPKLAARHAMRPASYVDIDCDLYSSSFDALDWLFRSGLIQVGTAIGYDDWYDLPCTLKDSAIASYGQPRAHREVATKYGVVFRCFCGPCKPRAISARNGSNFPGGRVYFVVEKLGGAVADDGWSDQVGRDFYAHSPKCHRQKGRGSPNTTIVSR